MINEDKGMMKIPIVYSFNTIIILLLLLYSVLHSYSQCDYDNNLLLYIQGELHPLVEEGKQRNSPYIESFSILHLSELIQYNIKISAIHLYLHNNNMELKWKNVGGKLGVSSIELL